MHLIEHRFFPIISAVMVALLSVLIPILIIDTRSITREQWIALFIGILVMLTVQTLGGYNPIRLRYLNSTAFPIRSGKLTQKSIEGFIGLVPKALSFSKISIVLLVRQDNGWYPCTGSSSNSFAHGTKIESIGFASADNTWLRDLENKNKVDARFRNVGTPDLKQDIFREHSQETILSDITLFGVAPVYKRPKLRLAEELVGVLVIYVADKVDITGFQTPDPTGASLEGVAKEYFQGMADELSEFLDFESICGE